MRLKKFFEFKESDLDPIKSFHLKDELNPKLWTDFELDRGVHKNLVKIATDFYDSLELKGKIKDIILTGSLCNYNWSEKYSDYDLHILVNFSDISDDLILVKKFVDAAKTIWNKEHNIKLKGYEVEIYIQDEKEKHRSTGVYSLLNDKWKVKPNKEKFEIDEDLIAKKAESIMLSIDDLEKESKEDLPYTTFKGHVKKVWEKIKKMRLEALDEGGEYSTGNLVFKLLRRNGYIEKIMIMKKNAYEKQFTLNEGILDWFKDSEEDAMGKQILKKLDDVDPEDIEMTKDNGNWILFAKLGNNLIRIERSVHYGARHMHSNHNITINDSELPCSSSIKAKIYSKLVTMYNDEKKRQNIQKISTDLNI